MIIRQRPEWEPDEDVSRCPLCLVHFGFFTRKHHCRDCGRVICGNCSGSRILLPHLGYFKPQRVCDMCVKEYVQDTHGKYGRIASKWITLISDPNSKKQLNEAIVKGIPKEIRSIIWGYMCDVEKTMSKNVGLFYALVKQPNKELEDMLQHDVPRAFSEIPFFENGPGQERMIRVLKAYGNFKVYAQHMTYLAGVLLMHMDEEQSFWCLVQMMKRYHLDPIFQSQEHFTMTYEKLLKKMIPNLYEHFKHEQFSVEIFILSWIQTLFSQIFDLELVVRLWDLLFYRGFMIMIKFTIAVLQRYESNLIQAKGSDVMILFQSIPQMIDDHESLIQATFKLKLNNLDLYQGEE